MLNVNNFKLRFKINKIQLVIKNTICSLYELQG